MIPDKFNLVDMGGIDVLESQGVTVSGLYNRLVNAISNCRYQCLYNWKFDGIYIAPTYAELIILAGVVKINDYIWVTQDDIVHIYSIEQVPVIEPLNVSQNGVYTPAEGVDGFSPVDVQVSPILQQIEISENGVYTPEQGVDGFSSVEVEVLSSTYTNAEVYEQEVQITDVSAFQKLYSSSIPFGNSGAKVSSILSVTNEASIAELQSRGWNASGMSYYDSENQIGAYGGYIFDAPLEITKAKFWIGRYSGQNNTLYVTIQYMNENQEWIDIADFPISSNITYPNYVITVRPSQTSYGIRWIHKNLPQKTSGNNISFAGMSLYRGLGDKIPAYIPSGQGLILPPNGYVGFGPLFIE